METPQPIQETISSVPSTSTSTSLSTPQQLGKPVPLTHLGRGLGVVEALSATEQADYDVCEAVVQKGWDAFVQVGLALARIRDKKLYRAEFNSFEEYCRQR
jgi:hypothetical protein